MAAGAFGLASAALRSAEHRHTEVALDRRVQSARAAVTIDLRRYTETLQDLSVATAAQRELTADDFDMITSRVRRDRLPGVDGVLFLNPNGTVRFGRAVAAPADQGDAPSGQDDAPGGRDADPADLIRPAHDVVGAAAAAEALESARDSGAVTASGAFARADGTTVLVLVGPVFAGASEQDPGNFQGWVLMTLRTDEFLADTLRLVADDDTEVRLTDVTDPAHPVQIAGEPDGGDPPGGPLRRQVDLPIAQRTMQLSVTATGSLVEGAAAYADEVALTGGLLIAGLLAGITWLLATSRERALAGVEQATTALRADIARRETIEAQLRDRESELAGFVAVAAHDLKTPLTNVAAYADLLAEVAAEDLDATCLGFVERIGSGTRRMTRLINDLLDFATADNAPLKPESVDLNGLVADVVMEHTAYLGDARPNIEVGPLPTVQGDPATLRRLLDNLISNAIKYVRHGDTAQISIGARSEPGGWRVEVADRGIGVPAEQREAVFAAFHRDRPAEGYPGTGLGLAICKRVVDRHGGHIGLEANPGGGSRFWFTLPAAPARNPRVPEGSAQEPAADEPAGAEPSAPTERRGPGQH